MASASRQRTGESSTAAKSSDGQRPLALGGAHRGDLHDVRAHLHAERAQKRLRQRAAGDARGGLARGGPLEDVAHIALLVLPGAHQVGVAGTRQVHLGDRCLHRPRVHPLLPVGVVAVGDLQRDGAAERAPVPHARGHGRRVALDLHPPAAAVPELPARHVGVDLLGVQLEARGQALDDRGQAGAVGLAGGGEAQDHAPPAYRRGWAGQPPGSRCRGYARGRLPHPSTGGGDGDGR